MWLLLGHCLLSQGPFLPSSQGLYPNIHQLEDATILPGTTQAEGRRGSQVHPNKELGCTQHSPSDASIWLIPGSQCQVV